MKLHTPSLLAGALAAALVPLLVAAAAPRGPVKETTYAVSMSDDGDAIRINVLTGETWARAGLVWVPMTVRD